MILDEPDVLVVGGGPAGIAAAVTAAERGSRVVLVDQGRAPGGQIWRRRAGTFAPFAARRWLARLERSGVGVECDSEVVDSEGTRSLTVVSGIVWSRDTAPAIVLATGARELFLPFPGWTLPGVLGAGGLQALLKGGLDVRGRRVV